MLILTRKEKADLTRTEEYVRDRINRTLRGIRAADITFVDEIYRLIDARIESLDYLDDVRVPIVDQFTPLESSLYNTMAGDIRELSEINLETIKDVYDGLSEVYDDVYSEGESISEGITICENLLTKVESDVKNRMNVSSVKDEVTVVVMDETISESDEEAVPSLPALLADEDEEEAIAAIETLIEGVSSAPTPIESLIDTTIAEPAQSKLNVDQNGGFITLPVKERQKLEYTIKSLDLNRDKGRLIPLKEISPGRGNLTIGGSPDLVNSWNLFSDGYFHSRTFSENPIFENQFSSDVEPIYDNSLKSEYLVEYNTKSTLTGGSSSKLVMDMALDISDPNGQPSRIDHVVVELSMGDQTSVRTSRVVPPMMRRMTFDQRHVTSEVLNKTVRSPRNGVIITGANPWGFKITPSTPNPIGSFMTRGWSAKTVTMQMRGYVPQLVWFPEKRLYNSSGGIMRKLNYLETLILNDYEPPNGHPDPRDLYTRAELEKLWDSYYAADSDRDQRSQAFRYFIGIKDISLYSLSYETAGYTISENLNKKSGVKIASVQIFTNEIVPAGAEINYYISHDKTEWYPISPVGKRNPESVATRVVYSSLPKRDGDVFIGANSSRVFLKIEMKSTVSQTPILKGYLARLKYA